MFARFRNFVRNHWKKVVFGGIAFHVMYRLTEFTAKKYLIYTEKRTNRMLKTYKKQQLFEMMEERYHHTFRNWYNVLKENIKRNLNAEGFTDRLKRGAGDKYENWTELKVVAFSSILALVNGSAMLSVLLRAQMNMINGILYKQMEEYPPGLEGVSGANVLGERKLTEEMQHDMLCLTEYLCTRGMDALCSYMYEITNDVVSKLPLQQKLTIEDVEQIFVAIRTQKLSEDSKKFGVFEWDIVKEMWRYTFSEEMTKKYLFPLLEAVKKSENERDNFLRVLICDSYDIITSEDSRTILKFLQTIGINHYLDCISHFIKDLPAIDSDISQISEEAGAEDMGGGGDVPIEQPSVPLAKLIPAMNSFVDLKFEEDTCGIMLLNDASLKIYAANIYESFSCKDFD